MADKKNLKKQLLEKRQKRVRSKISCASDCPRLTVYKSLKHINVQVIDDKVGKTLVSVHDNAFKSEKLTKTQRATKVGETVAERCKEKGIEKVVFDRSGHKYHGVIKAIADGARDKGLNF